MNSKAMGGKRVIWFLLLSCSVSGFGQTHCIDVEPLKLYNSDKPHEYQPIKKGSIYEVWKLNNIKEYDHNVLTELKDNYPLLYGEKSTLSFTGDCLQIPDVSSEGTTAGVNGPKIDYVEKGTSGKYWRLYFSSRFPQNFKVGEDILYASTNSSRNKFKVSGVSNSIVSKTINGKKGDYRFVDIVSDNATIEPKVGDFITHDALALSGSTEEMIKKASTKEHVFFFPYNKKNNIPIWEGNSLQFRMPTEQETTRGLPPMIFNSRNLKMTHLFGMLHLKYKNKDEIKNVARISIETEHNTEEKDISQAIAGFFQSSIQNPTMLKIEDPAFVVEAEVRGNQINIQEGEFDVYFPIPCNVYNSLRINVMDNKKNEVSHYDYKGVEIERGHVTEIMIVDPEKKTCTPSKLILFEVGGNTEEAPLEEMIKRDDPSPVKASISFENTIKIKNAKVFAYHFLPDGTWSKCRHEKVGSEITNPTYVNFDNIEVYPGYNSYWGSAIVKDNCRNAKYHWSGDRAIKLFLKTETCPFDYHEFARADSLCGYIPLWNKKLWGAPWIRFEWHFYPDNCMNEPMEDKGVIIKMSMRDDNHFKCPFIGSNGIGAFVMCRTEGLRIIDHGTIKYRAATIYEMPYDTHIEEAENTHSFTTDIIGLENDHSTDKDGNLVFKGFFKTDIPIKYEANFSSGYFDGYERGVLIYDLGENPKEIPDFPSQKLRESMYPSRSISGDEFECTVNRMEFKIRRNYKIWAYLVVDDNLFLSDGIIYKHSESIFKNLPQLLNSYFKANSETGKTIRHNGMSATNSSSTNNGIAEMKGNEMPKWDKLVDYANKYVENRRLVEKYGSISIGDLFEKSQEDLVNEYKKIAKELGLGEDDPSSEGESVPFQSKGDLPYKVLSVTKKGVLLPPYMFNEMYAEKAEDRAIRLIEGVTIIKQSPLVLLAFVEVKIKLLTTMKDNLLPIYMYVPGNGPDGKRLGLVYLYPLIKGIITVPALSKVSIADKKIGDVFSIPVFIYGWGTPDMLDEMSELVFTNVDDDKDRRPKSLITIYKPRTFPKNSFIDWMDEWYKKKMAEYRWGK